MNLVRLIGSLPPDLARSFVHARELLHRLEKINELIDQLPSEVEPAAEKAVTNKRPKQRNPKRGVGSVASRPNVDQHIENRQQLIEAIGNLIICYVRARKSARELEDLFASLDGGPARFGGTHSESMHSAIVKETGNQVFFLATKLDFVPLIFHESECDNKKRLTDEEAKQVEQAKLAALRKRLNEIEPTAFAVLRLAKSRGELGIPYGELDTAEILLRKEVVSASKKFYPHWKPQRLDGKNFEPVGRSVYLFELYEQGNTPAVLRSLWNELPDAERKAIDPKCWKRFPDGPGEKDKSRRHISVLLQDEKKRRLMRRNP